MGDTRKDTGDMGSGDPEDTEIQGMGGPGGHSGDMGDGRTKATQGVGIQKMRG